MIRDIVTDEAFLAVPSQEATEQDASVAQGLLDIYEAHTDECVGLAANMIGEHERVIVFDDNGAPRLIYNPRIIGAAAPYKIQESCPSLEDAREAQRFSCIQAKHLGADFAGQAKAFRDWTTQVIQHEVDHRNGVVI